MDKILEFLGSDKTSALNTIIRIAAIVLVTALFAALTNAIWRRVDRRAKDGKKRSLMRLIRYVILGVIYVTAIIAVVSGNAKTTVSTVIASSGIVAVVLSIACQEPIGNICSGFIMMLSHPFQIGDVVRYVEENTSGTVEEITMRHTVIRTFENKRLIIPNGVMNKSVIENYNITDKKLCIPLEFTITYESDAEKAIQIIKDVIMRHPNYDEEKANAAISSGKPPVQVNVNRFDPSGVVLSVWVWAANFSISITMKSDILLGVMKRFNESGVALAYPHVQVVQ
jgi:small-conductance mechanosensitive channel